MKTILILLITTFALGLNAQTDVTLTKEQVKELAKSSKDLNKRLRQQFPDVFDLNLTQDKIKYKQGVLAVNGQDSLALLSPSVIRPDDSFKLNWEKFYYDIEAVSDTLGNTEIILRITPK